jgi:hypothetical protein
VVFFALGYLVPVALDARFQGRLPAAIRGTAIGVGCAMLVFVGINLLVLSSEKGTREFLDKIARSHFNSVKAGFVGACSGTISGLVYPVTAWIRPFTGGRSIDDVFGRFLWSPVGAIYAFAIVTTWGYMRADALHDTRSRVRMMSLLMWLSGLVIAVGVWLLFAVPGLFPSRGHGIDLSAPYSWTAVLPWLIVIAGIGGMLFFGTQKTRIEKSTDD